MLRTFWRYATTPCPPSIRKMGYLAESVAIELRKKRYQKAWRLHIQNCHQAIREAVIHCPVHNNVMVIGGGTTYDVPLRLLAKSFTNVTLLDLTFTKQVYQAARLHDNITLLQADITGVVNAVYHRPDILPSPTTHTELKELFNKASLVISSNVWSQLPTLPARYASAYHESSQLHQWVSQIYTHHLEQLSEAPGHVCLISNYKTPTTTLPEHIPIPEWRRSWQWHITPYPELDKHPDIYHIVGMCTKKEITACLSPCMESETAIL